MDLDKIYNRFMEWGKITGCHQIPERSFFIHGRQFPVCARCTGVFLGELLGVIFFRIGEIPVSVGVILFAVMLVDWGIQAKGIFQSTNIRRLVTGLMCGYAFANFVMKFLRYFSETI